MRKLPIVIPAALVFVGLDGFVGNARAGEMLDGLCDRLAVGFGDIHQHAIHIEDQSRRRHGFQISSNAVNRRRVCSRVPTVMRTQPGAS